MLCLPMGGRDQPLDFPRLDTWIKSLIFGVPSRHIKPTDPYQIKHYVTALKECYIAHATPTAVFEDPYILRLVEGGAKLRSDGAELSPI